MIRVMESNLDEDSWWYKELTKLGCDMDYAEQEYGLSFCGVHLDPSKLRQNGYEYIDTSSSDYTYSAYTNGIYVVSSVAISDGYVSIQKLGPRAKKIIDSGETFDSYNYSYSD